MKLNLSIKPYRPACFSVLALALLVGPSWATNAFSQENLEQEASWEFTTAEFVYGQFRSLAEGMDLPEEKSQQLEAIWADRNQETNAVELRALTLESAVIVAPQTREMVEFVKQEQSPLAALDRSHLADESISPWLRNQLALSVGIWFAQHSLFDEAIESLTDLECTDSVDPAALLFYRGLSYQQIVNKEAALKDLKRLLEREEELPRRFRDVTTLVVADLAPLEKDSLDEIARLMDDIQRRQELYRSGTKVRKEEDDVIAKLDKLIEELEQQQQQMMMAAAGAAPAAPAPDSVLKGGAAPGDVDERAQGSGEDWGDLPAKERAAAMAELAKDLPTHYRELIEQYYLKLAEDPNASGDDR